MPHSTDIHLLVMGYDTFTAFLEDLDSEQHRGELNSALDGVGIRVKDSFPEIEHLKDREIGYAKVLWETHHDDELQRGTIDGGA